MASNRTSPLSSRLLVHIVIGISALACFCCAPHYTHPYVGKKQRKETEERLKGTKRSK